MDRTIIRKEDIESAQAAGPRIVAVGGGTGQSTMLRGLKHCTENLTAIVTVSDDGGGSGLLRHDLGMLPPGDIRACVMALANTETTMSKLLQFRFDKRSGQLSGQSFGNLFLAALNGVCGSFDEAVSTMCEVLAITGRVLPVTTSDVHLLARFENGTSVLGESKIFSHKKEHGSRIVEVKLVPDDPPALPAVLTAIAEADFIILGPGSLYTSVIPNLLVSGLADAIAASPALKVYVCNIMTQEGETEGYTAFDHIEALIKHARRSDLIDLCLVNNSILPRDVVVRYEQENASPIVVDRARFAERGIELAERPLTAKNDIFVRHDPLRLAYNLLQLLRERRPRAGEYGQFDRLVLEWMRSLCN